MEVGSLDHDRLTSQCIFSPLLSLNVYITIRIGRLRLLLRYPKITRFEPNPRVDAIENLFSAYVVKAGKVLSDITGADITSY